MTTQPSPETMELDDAWDDFWGRVGQVYADSGLTALMTKERHAERKSAAWWLEWTAEQLAIAEQTMDWKLVMDMHAVLREVVKRGWESEP